MFSNSLWFVGWAALQQLIPVHPKDYADSRVTARSRDHCLNIFTKDPKNYAAFPSKLENQPFTLCPKYEEQIPRGKIWFTFGFDRTDLKNLPMEGKAKWQSTYETTADTDEIVFNADYCITELSKTTPWIAGNVICPSCSERDFRANGAPILESNPYAISEYLGTVPDPQGLAGRCNGKEGTPQSLLPAGTDTAPSGETSLSKQFNLQTDTEFPQAALAPATNDGRYAYIDPLSNAGSGSSGYPTTDEPLPNLGFSGSRFPYIDELQLWIGIWLPPTT